MQNQAINDSACMIVAIVWNHKRETTYISPLCLKLIACSQKRRLFSNMYRNPLEESVLNFR
jgi:hypothetical protein